MKEVITQIIFRFDYTAFYNISDENFQLKMKTLLVLCFNNQLQFFSNPVINKICDIQINNLIHNQIFVNTLKLEILFLIDNILFGFQDIQGKFLRGAYRTDGEKLIHY